MASRKHSAASTVVGCHADRRGNSRWTVVTTIRSSAPVQRRNSPKMHQLLQHVFCCQALDGLISRNRLVHEGGGQLTNCGAAGLSSGIWATMWHVLSFSAAPNTQAAGAFYQNLFLLVAARPHRPDLSPCGFGERENGSGPLLESDCRFGRSGQGARLSASCPRLMGCGARSPLR